MRLRMPMRLTNNLKLPTTDKQNCLMILLFCFHTLSLMDKCVWSMLKLYLFGSGIKKLAHRGAIQIRRNHRYD